MLGVLVDHQHCVAARIALEVVAEVEVEPRPRDHARQGVEAAVGEAPGIMVVDHVDASRGGRIVVELRVVRPPPVVVALQEDLQPLAGGQIDFAPQDVLVARVEGALDAVRVGVVESPLVVLLGHREADLRGEVDLVLPADAQHLVAAVALGGAGLELRLREGAEAVGVVGRAIDHQPTWPHGTPEEGVDVVARIGVAARGQGPAQMV